LSQDNLCGNDLGIVVRLIVSEKVKIILLAAGQWFSPVSSTNKADCHDITEILLKGALNTINYLPQQPSFIFIFIEQCLCIALNII
jgi:hypothetical protein